MVDLDGPPDAMRLVLFGTYDSGRHPRVRVLAEGLAERGNEIIECNEPLGLDTAFRVRLLRAPWLIPLLVGRLIACWLRLWRRARSAERVDAVVVGYMGQFDVHLARRVFKGAPVVLDYLVSGRTTGIDRGSTSAPILRVLAWIDEHALRASDLVLVDTVEHLELLPAPSRSRAIVVPVGAPNAWFRPEEKPRSSQLRIVFFGLYTPLQGAPVIGRAIRRLRDVVDITFTMIGSGQDLPSTRREASCNPRVRWLEWVDPSRLAEVVWEHDVCLGIFGTTPKARRVVPNKVFQGMAARCAVVTSDTPPQRRLLEDAALFVPPGDADALAHSLRWLVEEHERLARYQAAAARLAERSFRSSAVVEPLHRRLAGS